MRARGRYLVTMKADAVWVRDKMSSAVDDYRCSENQNVHVHIPENEKRKLPNQSRWFDFDLWILVLVIYFEGVHLVEILG